MRIRVHCQPTVFRIPCVAGGEEDHQRRVLLQGSSPSPGTALDLPLIGGNQDYSWQKAIIDKHSKNNRVIVCGANYGFRSWIQQWYVSLRRTGVTEVVIIALDRKVRSIAKR